MGNFTLDLISPRYGLDAVGFFNLFKKDYPLGSTAKGVKFDGDFATANPTGIAVHEYPFAHLGDRNSAIVRQPMMQLANAFVPLQLGTRHPNDARLLLIDETDFRDAGGGVVTWTRVYASQPQAHDELGSCVHGFQYLSSRSPLTVSEKQITVACKVRTEYFEVKNLPSYPVLLASRFEQMTETLTLRRGDTQWNLTGELFTTTEDEIVADDSEIGYWHYPFMFRSTRYVQGPTLAFWGHTYTLPGA